MGDLEKRRQRDKGVGKSDASFSLQKKRASTEFLRTKVHLRPKTNTFGAVRQVDPQIVNVILICFAGDFWSNPFNFLFGVQVDKSDPFFPIQKKRASREFLRKKAHLRPRTNTFGVICFAGIYDTEPPISLKSPFGEDRIVKLSIDSSSGANKNEYDNVADFDDNIDF
ncbi:hypothetical protein Ahy_A07g036454 [Arachis hypogaea]|uniref:Uncharacterized protein n=1 Tax=Arachis hypogaea TaxID=3818 RepID=A0A445CG74_ARAHY|nr:hypothetical protein Ahy_A07g036454 [Arachis hypogaea]